MATNASNSFAANGHVNGASSSDKIEGPPLNDIIRRVVFDMHSIFRQVRSLNDSLVSTLDLTEAMQFSRLYRSAIKNAIAYLNESTTFSDADKTSYGNTLISAQIIWSLLETITLRPSANSPVIDLVEWNRENACTVPDERLSKMMTDLTVLDNNSKVENHPDYWTMVLQQVMFANFDTAVTLLKFHSKYKADDMSYLQIVSSLELIGLALARNETSTDEFVGIQKNLESLRSIVPTACHDLKYFYSVLLGESQMFIDCCSKLDMKWYEILPVYLLFVYPKAGMRDLGRLAKQLFDNVQQKFGVDEFLLDKIFLSALNMDFLETIRMICSTGPESWWLSVHLIDLISMHDPSVFLTPMKQESVVVSLHTRILVSYAHILIDNGLWQLFVDYYMSTGLDGVVDDVDERLRRFDWAGDVRLAERIVATCQHHGFGRTKGHLTRAVAIRYAEQKRWSAALCWAVRNGSVDLIAQVGEQILLEADADEMAAMHMFDKMSDSFLVTPELQVLYKFYKYRRCVSDGDLIPALSIIHEIFLSNNAPDRFFVTILREISRLLQVFNADEMALQSLNLNGVRSSVALDEISEMRSNFDADAIESLIKALTKFEYFYATHYIKRTDPGHTDVYNDVHRELRKLKPQLTCLLSHAFLADQS